MSVSAAAQYTVHALSQSVGQAATRIGIRRLPQPSAKNGDVWSEFYPLLDN
jgi:hypothetical protein